MVRRGTSNRFKNGAPFDMFFSANLDYPKKLEAAGLTEAESTPGSQRVQDQFEFGLESPSRP
jgi:hypothetical protein